MLTTAFSDVKHLHQSDLARRWCISPRTLERWRVEGHGPAYLKIRGRVVYRLEDIEAYEAAQIHCPANEPRAGAAGT
ncbi:helix-turn-helix domain-containing protein [Emcibacter sp. SYSU 3D8]|uniref:helix-turn-helix domain-containing protein n=1 Tax=Emcibacter sp. SYSU 3D8 TaxID=3133969 RepID=UPI0031FEB029